MARRNPEEQRMQSRFFEVWRTLCPCNALAFSIPNEGARSPGEGARMKAAGLTAGAPDVGLIVEGRFFGLEFKTAKGRMTPAQTGFAEAMRAAGSDHFVVRSESEAIEKARAVGVAFRLEAAAAQVAASRPARAQHLPLRPRSTSRRRRVLSEAPPDDAA